MKSKGGTEKSRPQVTSSGKQSDLPLEILTRDDIYRQRVMGTESGMGNFIKVDDKRKLTVISMFVYLFFIFAAMQFVWGSGVIRSQFAVSNAVRTWLESKAFKLDPEPKYFRDIQTLEDMQDWLRYGLPGAISPAVQHLNFPLNQVRFTLRRIQSVNNPEERFQKFAAVTWKDKFGITSTHDSTNSDDKDSFGVYREFGFNTANATGLVAQTVEQPELNYDPLGLEWCSKESASCVGDILDQKDFPEDMPTEQVIATCNDECQDMERNGRLCYCWTLSNNLCRFFHVAEASLASSAPVPDGDCSWNRTSEMLYPQLQDYVIGSQAFFPKMKRFTYDESGRGFEASPGFVMSLGYWTQDDVDKVMQAVTDVADARNSSTAVQWRSAQYMLYQQVNDWVLGGFIGSTACLLAADFVNWNPNYEVLSWVQLRFEISASGRVTSEMKVPSMLMSSSNLENAAAARNSVFWVGFGMWDALYIILVGYFFLTELYDFACIGMKYFASGWQILNVSGIIVHITTILLRYNYHRSSEFTIGLAAAEAGQEGYVLDLQQFEAQGIAWFDFSKCASIMMVFLYSTLVHYLNDLFPRIAVLVSTVYRSMTPVFFLVIILCDVFFGFVIWCHLMFGNKIQAFSTVATSAISCTEMIFGRLSAVSELRSLFPVLGFAFYLSFMIFFFFILQYLSRAIVLLSFDDASTSYEQTRAAEEQRRSAESARNNDQLTRVWKKSVVTIRKAFGLKSRRRRDEGMPRYGLKREVSSSKISILIFAIFAAIYAILVSSILSIGTGYALVASITSALKDPTFSTVDVLSKEVMYGRDFDSIRDRQDVMRWISQALPKALFESSTGTFGDSDNPLKSYHAFPSFKQIVINDWNTLLGQTPIRLSVKYDKLAPVSPNSGSSRFNVPQMIREDEGDKRDVTGHSEIMNSLTRQAVQAHCGNYTVAFEAVDEADKNGFACMLSVDQLATEYRLRDMEFKGLASNQTRQMALEFVVYNGNFNMFVYVAIIFDFTPSGLIEKRMDLEAVRLPETSGGAIGRIFLEIAVMLFTVSYLALSLRGMYKAVLNMSRKGRLKSYSFLQRFITVLQVMFLHILGNPFNLLDLLSSVMTIVTMFVWYSITMMDLSQGFFFPETPEWTTTQCASSGICSDSDVIFKFARASARMRFFARICTVNTVILFFRSLKYLEAFSHVRIIFNTLIRGGTDILCFLVVMVVLLMGYVAMGHTIFGPLMEDFSTVPFALITNFQMFLGTFRKFEQMRQASGFEYYFYWGTYMVLFRYVLVNMFFAIIAKHFRVEDEAMSNMIKEKKKAKASSQTDPGGGFFGKMYSSMKSNVLQFAGREPRSPSPRAEPESDVAPEVAAEATDEEGDDPTRRMSTISVTTSQASVDTGSAPPARSSDEQAPFIDVSHINDNAVQDVENWRYLPDSIREWALHTAKDLFVFIEDACRMRSEAEGFSKEELVLDQVMQETETAINDRRLERGIQAEQMKKRLEVDELRSLKEIHQDQESLAWYIMKRETELKKLEQTKGLKQDRFDKMVNAAQSLISSDG
eukprot:gb/GFBE01082876.1/.p1 GENE.gb/GFBE01082876.1/~~gb/GFBE01082876.1/.p1  ORF type:complete len:1545 (+),score=371.86 gb/GFBE01082876.1/:1-4635(+)